MWKNFWVEIENNSIEQTEWAHGTMDLDLIGHVNDRSCFYIKNELWKELRKGIWSGTKKYSIEYLGERRIWSIRKINQNYKKQLYLQFMESKDTAKFDLRLQPD